MASKGAIMSHFNCTIQELKRLEEGKRYLVTGFQLHHTGIKTQCEEALCHRVRQFQLHHTGIKTWPSSRL